MEKTHKIIIDIGNSRVKLFCSERAFYSIKDLIEFLLTESIRDLDLFIVSTVNTEAFITELKEELSAFDIKSLEIFDASKQTEIKEIYEGLGADRVAKLLGASILNPAKNIILMDFGTATTISVLDSEKNFKGGFIGLGMRSSLQALSEYCDALADYSQDPELGELIDNYDEKTIYENKSTKRAILLGAVNSHTALINQWIHQAKQMLELESSQFITICTGGEAGYFERFFDKRTEEADLLKAVQNQVSSQQEPDSITSF